MHETHQRGLEDCGFAATQMLDLNPVQARHEPQLWSGFELFVGCCGNSLLGLKPHVNRPDSNFPFNHPLIKCAKFNVRAVRAQWELWAKLPEVQRCAVLALRSWATYELGLQIHRLQLQDVARWLVTASYTRWPSLTLYGETRWLMIQKNAAVSKIQLIGASHLFLVSSTTRNSEQQMSFVCPAQAW